mgnify:CR=1 FL=1
MKEHVLITDFTGVCEEEGLLRHLQERGVSFRRLDLSGIEGTCCYCDDAAASEISGRLPSALPRIRWIDSGDYHYMSHLLALRENASFHLVLLDNHRDDQQPAFGSVLSCGGWVQVMREKNPMLRDVLTIGPEGCPRDIPAGWLENRRGERVYISLDKDILSPDYARTDWSQGTFTLEEVKAMLSRLMDGTVVVGAVDICGELSGSKGGGLQDYAVNLRTNIELMDFISVNLK